MQGEMTQGPESTTEARDTAHLSSDSIDDSWVTFPPISETWSGVAEDAIRQFVLPVICFLGILGLVLTLIVLTRRTMRTSTNCYLTALSAVDLLFLLLLASILTDIHQAFDNNVAQFLSFLYMVYAGIIMNVLLMVSVWLTVVLAVERYLAICLPFLASVLCTINKARVVIATVVCLAVLSRLPNFWEKRVTVHYRNSSSGTVQYDVEDTKLAVDETYMAVYPVVVDVILASVVPFLLLLFLNVLLVVEVKRSTRYLQRNIRGVYATAEREEHQVTVMLVSIIMVAFVCQAPYVVYTAINSIHRFSHVSAHFQLFRHVTIFLLTLKSALNFVVYCWSREKFWMTLRAFLCAPCGRAKAGTQSRWSQSGSYYSLQVHSTCVVPQGTAL